MVTNVTKPRSRLDRKTQHLVDASRTLPIWAAPTDWIVFRPRLRKSLGLLIHHNTVIARIS